jgi:hypothetical protein
MKKVLSILIILAMAWVMPSCEDDGAPLYSVTVSVTFPDGLTVTDKSDVTVKALNTVTAIEKTVQTDNVGNATFLLEAGTYTFSATQTTDEFVFNGITANQTVNATSLAFVVDLVAASRKGGLVIKEIYYTGSLTPASGSYYSDQFVEIYNNSDSVIYLDNLCLSVMDPNSSATENVWAAQTSKLPMTFHTWTWAGNGTSHPLQPRTSVVVAQDGFNHKSDAAGNPNSPVDLGNAHYETYVEAQPTIKDVDYAGVPNLTLVYTTTTTSNDWLMPVFGPALVIFRLPIAYTTYASNPDNFMTKPGSTASTEYLMIDPSYVIDAVECVRVEEDKRFKRVPVALDAGMVWCNGTYTSQSVRRKVEKIIDGKVYYKDTNNSSEDFKGAQTPTPFVHPTSVD